MAAVWEGMCLLTPIHSDLQWTITPFLSSFSFSGHVECVSILLKAGADKKGTAPDGTSLIDAAEKQEIRDLLA